MKPTYEELHKIFEYNPKSGLLIRKNPRQLKHKKVGTLLNNGYRCVSIKNKRYLAHCICYCMHHGYWAENDIDHINRNRDDNRIENLREISRSCNLMNTGNSAKNTSGVRGVCWNKRTNKWMARITIHKKNIYIGSFKDFDSAVKARFDYEQKQYVNICNTDSPAKQYIENCCK